MNFKFVSALCDGDGLCVHACPMQIVKLTQDQDQKYHVTLVDAEICVGCGSCVAACENDALVYS